MKETLISVSAALLLLSGCGGSGSSDKSSIKEPTKAVHSSENGAKEAGTKDSNTNIATNKSDSNKVTNSRVTLPKGYSKRVVNNKGKSVSGEFGDYRFSIFSNSSIAPNPKDIHKGVAVIYKGVKSKAVPIEISYLNKEIVVALFDKKGNFIKVSKPIKVSDVPVVVVNFDKEEK